MKSFASFLSFLAVLGAVASGVFYYLNAKESNTLEQELQTVQLQLNSERSKTSQLTGEIEEIQGQLDQNARSLQESRSNITVLSARSNQLKRENQRLTDELEMRLANEESLQRSLADLKKDMAEQKANSITLDEVDAYTQKIATLEAEVLRLKDTQNNNVTSSLAETYPSMKTAPSGVSGSVLTVGAGSSFVITNLGYTEGIRLDYILSIQREGQVIANIQVTEVKENLSIARILPESLKNDPQPGDLVVGAN